MRVEFSDFRDSFAALPPGRVSLDDARVPQFCIYEDTRIIAYYAPFDYLNMRARVVLVGVTPGPTQMLESYAIARDALRAGRADQDVLRQVKAHASFKGMRKDLGLVLDEARANGARLEVTALVDQFYAELQAMGGRRWDTSSLAARAGSAGSPCASRSRA